ncbi:MAG: DUF2807 domain-containing protein [Sulfurovaceae bacterium]|nr:DUF2807 domain-containing protein [Sulfurovaceae bacterium]
MKKYFTLCVIVFFAYGQDYSFISGSTIINSNIGEAHFAKTKVVKDKTIPKENFNQITVSGAFQITVNSKLENSFILETNKEFIKNISFNINNSNLDIKMVENIINPIKLNITINAKSLNTLKVNGASTIIVNNFRKDEFKLSVDGASTVIFNNGVFNNFFINSDGSYDINLLKSKIKNANIDADGSGIIKLNVIDYLKAKLDGTVDVKYHGNPKIKKDIKSIVPSLEEI